MKIEIGQQFVKETKQVDGLWPVLFEVVAVWEDGDAVHVATRSDDATHDGTMFMFRRGEGVHSKPLFVL